MYAVPIGDAASRAVSKVDQPLCVECAAKVVAEVDATTRAAEQEAAAYEAALERLQVRRRQSSLQDASDASQPILMHHTMRNSCSLGLLTTSASRLTLLTLQAQPDEALPDAAYKAQLAAAEAEAQQERCDISTWQLCALSLPQLHPLVHALCRLWQWCSTVTGCMVTV